MTATSVIIPDAKQGNYYVTAIQNGIESGESNKVFFYTGAIDDITVDDNGKGIDTRIINKLFKGQLDPIDGGVDSNRFRGIGLAVCKTIVNAHGGQISAENLPEGGAEFKFTLPMEDTENEHQG